MIRYESVNETGQQLVEKLQSLPIDFEGEAIVFVGALGICVRKILPHVDSKYTDPAVVCIDSTGHYVIPVLSGHVGGANELARSIARQIGAEAIITTQSDNLGLWALDTLAHRFGWQTGGIGHDAMNRAIALFVNQRSTALVVEHDDEGTRYLHETLPAHVTWFDGYDDFLKAQADGQAFELLIVVSARQYGDAAIATLHYCPPCLHLGIGCQRETPVEAAEALLREIGDAGYAPESIATIGTITLKQDEPLVAALAKRLPQATVQIHDASQLAAIDVPHPSDKVYEVTGCYGVAEAAALAHEGSRLVVEKQKGSVTIGMHTSYYTWALSSASTWKHGHIEIVGAGPGDPDLVSVRGRRFLQQADLILYAGSLVPVELTACAKPTATVRSSADMSLEEQFALMKAFYDRGLLVVRLHTGDPCIYGAIQEQMAFFDHYGMDYHITPGISSFLAAAAELKSQFTIPERCQTIILTRGEGRTPMPDKEKLQLLAQHQSTMCIFLSAAIVDEVMQQLLEGGYPPETPVAACYKLTWKEQRIYRGQLKDLSRLLHDHHLALTTMIVVGDAIDNRQGLSKLYDQHFTHLFRKGKA